MRPIKPLLIVVLAALLQASFLAAWRPAGVIPNLLLVVVIFLAATRPASGALAAALMGGLLLDLASGSDFGLRMGFYSLVALGVVVVKRLGGDYDDWALLVTTVIASALVFNLAVLANLAQAHIEISWRLAGVRFGIEAVFDLMVLGLLKPWSRYLDV